MAANFEKFFISPGFPLNFRKSHRISNNQLKTSESYGQKPLGVPKDPPGLNRVKSKWMQNFVILSAHRKAGRLQIYHFSHKIQVFVQVSFIKLH